MTSTTIARRPTETASMFMQRSGRPIALRKPCTYDHEAPQCSPLLWLTTPIPVQVDLPNTQGSQRSLPSDPRCTVHDREERNSRGRLVLLAIMARRLGVARNPLQRRNLLQLCVHAWRPVTTASCSVSPRVQSPVVLFVFGPTLRAAKPSRRTARDSSGLSLTSDS
ncbi:hypothetical protein OH76DRAFT_250414 [Lentinus brumalis]|uniref:Uncharacterized protein n=1 Tax=Lentinus brumalis TaxID=2498619 RepID=A0A371CLJ5_9APHY|nr:hypothetical protein OH76DRAFT_250414 [Polyporus brumalis]